MMANVGEYTSHMTSMAYVLSKMMDISTRKLPMETQVRENVLFVGAVVSILSEFVRHDTHFTNNSHRSS